MRAPLPRLRENFRSPAPVGFAESTGHMNLEIGFWKRTEDGRKLQVRLRVFGGKIIWECQPARFQAWEPYLTPDDDDWGKVIAEANKREPRRVIHDKMLALIRRRGRAAGAAEN